MLLKDHQRFRLICVKLGKAVDWLVGDWLIILKSNSIELKRLKIGLKMKMRSLTKVESIQTQSSQLKEGEKRERRETSPVGKS